MITHDFVHVNGYVECKYRLMKTHGGLFFMKNLIGGGPDLAPACKIWYNAVHGRQEESKDHEKSDRKILSGRM